METEAPSHPSVAKRPLVLSCPELQLTVEFSLTPGQFARVGSSPDMEITLPFIGIAPEECRLCADWDGILWLACGDQTPGPLPDTFRAGQYTFFVEVEPVPSVPPELSSASPELAQPHVSGPARILLPSERPSLWRSRPAAAALAAPDGKHSSGGTPVSNALEKLSAPIRRRWRWTIVAPAAALIAGPLIPLAVHYWPASPPVSNHAYRPAPAVSAESASPHSFTVAATAPASASKKVAPPAASRTKAAATPEPAREPEPAAIPTSNPTTVDPAVTDSEKEFAAGRLNISKFTTDKGLTVEAAFPASWKERKSNVTTVLSMYEDGGRGPVWCLIMAKPISEIGARNYRASNFGDLYNQSAAEIEFGSHTRLTSFKKGTLHAYTAFRLSWEGRVKDQDSGKSATRAAHEIRIAAGHFMVLFQITTLGPPNSPEAARILRDYQPLLERIADSLELNSRISLGRSRRPDRVARFLELKAAAEKSDDPVALRDTGYCYETGDGIAKDEKEAARWLQRAAARALTLIRKAAGDEANPIFAATLGELYNLGKDVPQDCVEAVKWFHRAAELGFAPAQFDLGCIYKNGGKGVPSDFTEAFKWARRAAEQNHPGAQGLLGHLYHTGEGVAKNTATAVTWYRKAAEQGYAPSQFKLGILHATADGAPEDFKEAVKWYEKAARQDDTDSQYALGMHHYLGRGVPVDKPKNVSQKIAKTIQV